MMKRKSCADSAPALCGHSPWYLSDGRYICQDQHGGVIARVHGVPNGPNALLLTAAPELLAALRALHDTAEVELGATAAGTTPYAKAVLEARAALAKATGEPDAFASLGRTTRKH